MEGTGNRQWEVRSRDVVEGGAGGDVVVMSLDARQATAPVCPDAQSLATLYQL